MHYLFCDEQNELWAGLTYGISRLEVNSPISIFNEKNGITGSIYNVRSINELYVSSNLSIFYYENEKLYNTYQLVLVFDTNNLLEKHSLVGNR